MNGVIRKVFAFIPLLLFMLLMSTAQAQENTEPKSNNEKTQAADVEQLKSKVEQLQSLVEQQQRAIVELQNRMNEMDSKARPAALTTSPTAPETGTPQPAVASLKRDASVTEAKQSNAVSAPANQAKAADKPVILAGWDSQGAFLRSSDGNFETRIGGYSQLDFRGYSSGSHPPNTFALRRIRLRIDGKLAQYYDFRIESDLADTNSQILRDAYLRIHRIDEAQLTFGQFKEPFSQEELRSDAFLDFVEKSLPNLLVPSRSPGLMLSGVINKGTFEYQVGAFNGKGLLRENNTGTPETVYRLRFTPWKNGKQFWFAGLSFGGAYAQGRTATTTSVRGQSDSRSFIFFTPDTISGKITRTNGELTWMLGPASLRAEYDQMNQERENLGANGSNLPGIVSKGYMAQFTYLLTGETKAENGPTTPKHSLFSRENGRMGFGAFEVKARYDDLQIIDGTLKSNRAQAFYFGTNWYLNRFVKHVLDFGFERFKDPLRSPNPLEKNYFVVLSRFQFTF